MNDFPTPQFRTVTIRGALAEAVDLYRAGRYDDCTALCRQVLSQRPLQAHALHLLGVVEIQRGNHEAAVPFFEQALGQQDHNAEFHSNFGSLLSNLKRLPEAVAHLRRAIVLKPDYPEAYGNLGSVLLEQGEFEEALEVFRKANALNPNLPSPHVGIGCAEKQLLHFPEAAGAFRRAIVIQSDNVDAHCNLSMVLLQMGAFREGWSEYEWRFKSRHWGGRTFRQPRWTGEVPVGKKILIPCEQGLGDTIQFIRYLPELKRHGAKVVFECAADLKTLLQGFPGIDLLIDWPRSTAVESGVDSYVPLMSLPMYFGTTLTSIPARIPYLEAPPPVAESWRERLAAPGVKVGLVWSGNPRNLKDQFRSCKLADFAPLANVPGVTFYSLQKGASAEQAKNPPQGMNLVNLDDQLTDFSHTAAAITNLDLVITVDTSVAHLAGAMGKPVWTLLPFSPDWRWMLVREDTPWYPTMRLFRQERSGDWPGVFGRVAKALREFVTARPPVRVLVTPLPLDDALRAYQEKRFADAERACRQVLETQPHHVEAMHLLGNVLFHAGQGNEALELFERAAAVRPGDAVVHFNLGVALLKIGRAEEAVASYHRALAVDPASPEVHYNLANLLRDRGQVDDASLHYAQAVAAKPDYVKARMNLGNLLRRQGRWYDAASHYLEALKTHPNHAKAHHHLAAIYQLQGKPNEAMIHARRAAEIEPDSAEFQNLAGIILQELGKMEEALACHDRASILRPDLIEAHAHRAAVLCRMRRSSDAAATMRRALNIQPRAAEAAHVLAKTALDYFGWIDDAERLLEACLQAKPDWAEAHFDLGEVRLFQGRWKEAFAENAWRTRIPSFQQPTLTQPRWDGERLPGKSLLLYGEQGYGDMIQFIRYAPRAAERVGRLVIGCPQPLVRLFSNVPGVGVAADRGDALGTFDVCASILDLPRIFGSTIENVPSQVPYLMAPDLRTPLPVPTNTRFKIGIAWSGNPSQRQNFKRACELSSFRELIMQPDMAFYSLQVGPAALDLERHSAVADHVIDLGKEFSDWADTASAVAQLDLIITVDTGVAHLAGALGKTTWLLLAQVPDARWMLDGDGSPWYPTMRIFRQKQFGDWPSVFDRVEAALKKWRRKQLLPPATPS